MPSNRTVLENLVVIRYRQIPWNRRPRIFDVLRQLGLVGIERLPPRMSARIPETLDIAVLTPSGRRELTRLERAAKASCWVTIASCMYDPASPTSTEGDLTDAQWEKIAPLLGKHCDSDQRGRPAASSREVMNGALWVIRSGKPWSSMPHRYPPFKTCHRRFVQWLESGALAKIELEALGAASIEAVYAARKHARSARRVRATPPAIGDAQSKPPFKGDR